MAAAAAVGEAAASPAAAGRGSGSGGRPVIILIVFAVVALFFVFGMFKAAQLRKRRRERVARVELASAEAAGDDAYFAADLVKAEAAALHRSIVAAWTGRDREALATLLGPDLLTEWVRRLDDFDRKGWHNVCELRSGPEVEYMGLVNREDDADDRVVVRVHGGAARRRRRRLRPRAQAQRGGRRDAPRSPSTGPSAAPASAGCCSRSSRTARARTTSTRRSSRRRGRTRRGCTTSRSPSSRSPTPCPTPRSARSSTSTTRATARVQAMDLSVVDGRFAPAVLEAAARRAVEAWAEAVDGADAALERAATPEAAHALLYPRGTNSRLVVRGPRLAGAADRGARRPRRSRRRWSVEAELRGRRYLEDRDTAAVLEGSKERETAFTERWTLALADDDPATPWRIVATAAVG